MSLTAWVERDPFHKEADFPSLNAIPTNNHIFMSVRPVTPAQPSTTSSTPLNGNLEFDVEIPVVVTARPQSSTTSNRKTTVDNKLDFITTTKPRKKRTTTTTRRPVTAIVDNKLDFTEKTTTKRPGSPFSKLGKENKNSINAKRQTKKDDKKRKDLAEERSDDTTDLDLTLDLTDRSTWKRLFVNEDNATKYIFNRPITARLEDGVETKPEQLETRSNFDKNYDNEYDYGDKPYRQNYNFKPRPSTYYPPYPPLNQPTNKRPVAFQNNRPNYEDSDFIYMREPQRPAKTPISNVHSTPFSYDTYDVNQNSNKEHEVNYGTATPLFNRPNRVSNRPIYQTGYRPTYSTTRRMDLSTFLFVDTTRRTSPSNFIEIKRTTSRPFSDTKLDFDYQLSYSTQSPNFYPPIGSSSSSFSSIANQPDDDLSNLSYFLSFSNANKFSVKTPTHENSEPFNNFKPISILSNGESDDDDDDFDGYLRPENSFYIPIKNKHKPSYNDYSQYNVQPEASKAKFYFIENVLHKYFEGKSEKDYEGLYDPQPIKRYAEFYDKHLTEKLSDDFVALTRTINDDDKNDETNVNHDNDDETLSESVEIKGRSRGGQENIFLVPFKVLTEVDRPDNWVNINKTTDQDLKAKLPEVPQLRQDNDVTKELPKPIFSRRRS